MSRFFKCAVNNPHTIKQLFLQTTCKTLIINEFWFHSPKYQPPMTHLLAICLLSTLQSIPVTITDELREEPSKKCNVEYSQVFKRLDNVHQDWDQWPHNDFAWLQEINCPQNFQITAFSSSKRSRDIYHKSNNSLPVHTDQSVCSLSSK
jgi:hypothetical protein